MKLQNKNALITGGASGIGRAISILFASEGAHTMVLDTNRAELDALLAASEGLTGKTEVHMCDVSDKAAVDRIVSGIAGSIDILINNAGVSHVGNLQQTREEDFDRVYRINIKGVYNCSHAVLGRMIEQGGGVILNMASVVSHVGIPDRFAYSMSKGAVLSMTYSIACDYVRHNIRCNCIAPARIHTPFVDGFLKANYPGREQEMFEMLAKTQPVGRMGTPEEVAHLVLYLCSDEASFITGTSIPFDGGFIHLKP